MKSFLPIILSFLFFGASAQFKTDSLAYQLQRKKINTMLAQRAVKFGQYDESLGKHTGIFGLQTKKDIRSSNEILMDIVKTDNDIYSELKILLEYRTFQQKQVLTHTNETENSTLGYMSTINKLRAQIDALKLEAETDNAHEAELRKMMIIAIIVLAALIFLMILFRRKKPAPVKSKRSTSRKSSSRR
ncbi:hypothetical protein [Mucilaginibacter flavidus]|uniref:hypothetical protein n=1 Tax=Mucilaginibacter flavidus TaxID=2949309 RepID=UPI002092325B|nr:hypothetical protein [Mucilaginibacter flavidus]MCO5950240.1 hypothetical protein [Mucilaginibacter flavidus]